MVNDLDQASETYAADNGGGRLTKGTMGMLASMAIGSGLGFLGGMLIGKKQGEARGLAMGLEIGRTEATAAMIAPRSWRWFWRRERAA
jgi:hypothetical protein